MKKVKINQEACIGCGTCAALCPQGFRMDGGKAKALNPADLAEEVTQTAIDSCPVNAIKWED